MDAGDQRRLASHHPGSSSKAFTAPFQYSTLAKSDISVSRCTPVSMARRLGCREICVRVVILGYVSLWYSYRFMLFMPPLENSAEDPHQAVSDP